MKILVLIFQQTIRDFHFSLPFSSHQVALSHLMTRNLYNKPW